MKESGSFPSYDNAILLSLTPKTKVTVSTHSRSCFPLLYLFFGHEGEQALRLLVCRACKELKS
jgi:hypothetical protein